MEKEHRYSKLLKTPENPFRKDMNGWYPNSKKLYKIAENWEKIVGSYIASHTQLLGVYNEGILYLACSDSVLGNEMRLSEKAFVEKINNLLGPDYIQKFRFNNARYVRNKPEKTINEEEKKPAQLTESQLNDIEKRLESVEDEELKESLRQIYINLLENS